MVQGCLPQGRPGCARLGVGQQRPGRAGPGRPVGLSGGDPPVVHPRRHGGLDRVQPRGVCRGHRARARLESGARGAGGGIGAGLEGVRARSDARLPRQLRSGLLDREFRSHGRAHRRLHHRRPGANSDRQGIPAHARRRRGRHPRSGRRDGGVEHPVRRTSPDRPHGRDRDEPAGLAQLGSGKQGYRFPHRQDCRAPRHRNDARRNPERYHAADALLLRAHN